MEDRVDLVFVGCGKMGLPIAVQAASRGLRVIGVDIDPCVVDSINRGVSPIPEPGVRIMIPRLVRSGMLCASSLLEEAVARARAVIVIVPVLLDGRNEADLRAAVAVAKGIARALRPGTVISFEMTLPVGTTRNVIAPILERSGLTVEKDFYLIFSPERVKSATVMRQMKSVPKVVGGFGARSSRRGVALYRRIFVSRVLNIGTLEDAEMVKLAGMIYRDVNIALSNELSRYCDAVGIDLARLIPAINTDGEAHVLFPGIGVGGHCTPVYPYFLIHDARRRNAPQRIATYARKVNDGQAAYLVRRLADGIGAIRGKSVLILGLGFRPDIKEDTKSPAYLMKKAIEERGGKAYIHDPLYSDEELRSKGFAVCSPARSGRIDALVLVTAHQAFRRLDWRMFKRRGVRAFVDGRNVFSAATIERHGIRYIGVGKGAG